MVKNSKSIGSFVVACGDFLSRPFSCCNNCAIRSAAHWKIKWKRMHSPRKQSNTDHHKWIGHTVHCAIRCVSYERVRLRKKYRSFSMNCRVWPIGSSRAAARLAYCCRPLLNFGCKWNAWHMPLAKWRAIFFHWFEHTRGGKKPFNAPTSKWTIPVMVKKAIVYTLFPTENTSIINPYKIEITHCRC